VQTVTRDLAVSCVAAHPKTQWVKYTARKKMEVIDQVNERLKEEGIYPLDHSAIEWRMHQVVRDTLKKGTVNTGK
jgi:hypothetical protein